MTWPHLQQAGPHHPLALCDGPRQQVCCGAGAEPVAGPSAQPIGQPHQAVEGERRGAAVRRVPEQPQDSSVQSVLLPRLQGADLRLAPAPAPAQPVEQESLGEQHLT